MKKYFVYFVTSFKSAFAYKVDAILFIILNLVFFLIFFFLWKSIYSANGLSDINSYSLSNTITYYFVTSFIFRLDLADSLYLNWDVWEGFFTNHLTKPWNVKFISSLESLSVIVVNLLLYLPFWLGIYLFARQYITFPTLPNAIFFAITLMLAFTMNMFLNLILHSLVFYFGDQEPNINLLNYIGAFLAGGMFPLAFLPSATGKFFGFLPFRFLFDVPTNIYLGRLSTAEIINAWGQIIIWIIFFYVVFSLVFKNGLKLYTGTGK